MNTLAWIFFLASSFLEVGGAATIRQGLRWRSLAVVVAGMAALGFYGLVVNQVKWDFSKLLGVYIAFFAVTSILFGRLIFHERIPWPTWGGLALILMGAMMIQFGATAPR